MHCSGHYKPVLVYKGDRFKKGFRASGNDRDEYVANNNGGFTIGHQPSTQLKPSTTYIAGYPRGFNSLGIDKTNRGNVKGHMVIYRQNGTGRDTYIMSNNGGFAIQEGSNEFCGYQESFKRSLRKYLPVEGRQSKIVTSNSPVRHRSVAGSLATTLNRFKVYQKQRGESVENETLQKDGTVILNKAESELGGVPAEKPKMGHYRTQSQALTKETTERIKEYLQQRNAFSRAQDLNRTLSQSSNGTGSKGRGGSHSQGRLFATAERSSSNPRSRNIPAEKMNQTTLDHPQRTVDDEASLIMAIKSSPSLNNAFNRRKQSNPFHNLQPKTTKAFEFKCASDTDSTSALNTRHLNQHSTEDLGVKKIHMKEKGRPMTTKFASRRLTQQPLTTRSGDTNPIMFPESQNVADDVEHIFERHGIENQTVMQMFNEQQKTTCARLSVPHSRRQRGRFSGTQNSFFFQTNTAATLDHSPIEETRANAFGNSRKGSTSSQKSSAFAPRVKSSLMGTSARQKLLKFKLAQQKTSDSVSVEQKQEISGHIAQINKEGDATSTFDHLQIGQQQDSARKDARKSEKQRQLENIYKGGRGNSRSNPGVRQALAATLRRNSKVGSERGARRNVFGGTQRQAEVQFVTQENAEDGMGSQQV